MHRSAKSHTKSNSQSSFNHLKKIKLEGQNTFKREVIACKRIEESNRIFFKGFTNFDEESGKIVPNVEEVYKEKYERAGFF